MKLWLDDRRPAPEGWKWAKTVEEAKLQIIWADSEGIIFEECSLDHDLGNPCGEDGIKLVDWMAEYEFWPKVKPEVHSMNPVGRIRMKRAIDRYFQQEKLNAQS